MHAGESRKRPMGMKPVVAVAVALIAFGLGTFAGGGDEALSEQPDAVDPGASNEQGRIAGMWRELADAEARTQELERVLAARAAELDQRQADLDGREAAVIHAERLRGQLPVASSPPAAAPAPQPPPAARPGTVAYANCDAARAAGAAPLRRDEPGYHPALDRDRDGVACE